MTQAVAKALIKDKLPGSIVNISSIVAKMGNIGQANYSASKGGVISMTKTCAKELSRCAMKCGCACVCVVGGGGGMDMYMCQLFGRKVAQWV